MKKILDYKDYRKLLLNLFHKINETDEPYQFVLGIAEGGLNVSFPISVFFKYYHKDILVSFYGCDEVARKTPNYSQFHLDEFLDYREWGIKNGEFKGTKFLWVDDIIDSGSTLKWFMNQTKLVKGKDFDVAALHWCPESSPDLEPEYYIWKKRKEDWIVYPWEV